MSSKVDGQNKLFQPQFQFHLPDLLCSSLPQLMTKLKWEFWVLFRDDSFSLALPVIKKSHSIWVKVQNCHIIVSPCYSNFLGWLPSITVPSFDWLNIHNHACCHWLSPVFCELSFTWCMLMISHLFLLSLLVSLTHPFFCLTT